MFSIFRFLLWFATVTWGHGTAEREHRELARRSQFFAHSKTGISTCSERSAYKDVASRSVRRRRSLYNNLRAERGNVKRDLAADLNKTHETNLTGVTPLTSPEVLFGANISCLLVPEITQGPYYVDGEYVRKDLRDGQAGIDLYVDVQFIDINTCSPISNAYIDFWHANATGVYSGIVEDGNGSGTSDEANINATFARGLQPTDNDGVAQFLTIFPGHYSGRTVHIHVLTHENITVRNNETITGGTIRQVGQLFFDQDLITEVMATYPYNTNNDTLTTNAEDDIMSEEAEDGFDPIAEYALLGDNIGDGILAWISFGINGSAAYTIDSASTLYASGGVSHNLTPGTGEF